MGKTKIALELDEYKSNNYLTHNYHPYPAKYIPQIPKEIILKFSNKNDSIIDPFCGSGTTLVEALLAERNCVGIDLNPIAYLISKTKTTILSQEKILIIYSHTSKICDEILSKKLYPVIPFLNIDHWFKKFVQREFAIIKENIRQIIDQDVKDFLTVAFSSIITKLSNQDSDTRYAFREKEIKEGESAFHFKKKVDDMLKRNQELGKFVFKSKCKVYRADSTDLSFIKDKFSLALTSPPYMNSYDYYLYHKHRMHWLGFDVKEVQEKEFGSRNKHNDNGHGIDTYNDAILKNAKEVKRILENGGLYCIVVGDAILRGELIKMDKVFDSLLVEQLGYKKIDEFKFDQRKYTRAFTPNIKNTFKETYILIYQS